MLVVYSVMTNYACSGSATGWNTMNRHLKVALWVWLALPAVNAHAQSGPGNCSYENASVNGGWGWDPVALLSCAPLDVPGNPDASLPDSSTNQNCDYSDAAQYLSLIHI